MNGANEAASGETPPPRPQDDSGDEPYKDYEHGVFDQGQPEDPDDDGKSVFDQDEPEDADRPGQGAYDQGHAERLGNPGQGVYDQGHEEGQRDDRHRDQ
ncbi:MAG: hypothetical protein ACR2GB_02475 [Nocardioidaceae bacterium]